MRFELHLLNLHYTFDFARSVKPYYVRLPRPNLAQVTTPVKNPLTHYPPSIGSARHGEDGDVRVFDGSRWIFVT